MRAARILLAIDISPWSVNLLDTVEQGEQSFLGDLVGIAGQGNKRIVCTHSNRRGVCPRLAPRSICYSQIEKADSLREYPY